MDFVTDYVGLWKSHFAQSPQSLHLEGNRAALTGRRTDLQVSSFFFSLFFYFFFFLFLFNSSFIAVNDSHWSLFGFLLDVVQDILWQKK